MAAIQDSIEKKLRDLLDGKGAKDKDKRAEDLEVLGLAIKWCAVKAKLDEDQWGADLNQGGELNGNDDEDRPKSNRAGAVRP